MKRIVALILVLLTVASVLVACKKQESDVVEILGEQPVQSSESDPTVSNSLVKPIGAGMVAAGGIHTLGARSDGTVIFAGHNTVGQNGAAKWVNVVYVAASDLLSVGVTREGYVYVAGNDELQAAVAEWTDIVTVAAGSAHLLGLKLDGTVVAAGDNAQGQCNVSAWNGIVAIAAAGNNSVALKSDGTVLAIGDNSKNQCKVDEWSGVVKIAAGPGQTAAVKVDGTACSTLNDVSAWTGMAEIAAGEAYTAGLTADGKAVCIPEDAGAAEIADAVSISGGTKHCVVVKKDGSVAAFGNDDDFQCNVTGWQVGPYLENGFLMGFAPGMTAEQVKAILTKTTGSAAVVLKYGANAAQPAEEAAEGEAPAAAAAGELADGDVITTGVEIQIDGAPYAMLVLLGDVNCDGIINAADGELITKYLDGDVDLAGAALAAACVKTDADGKPSKDAVTAINAASMSGQTVSQFSTASLNKYDAKIAEAKAKNEHVVGWIAIDGTNIDYPILFHPKEVWYYNDHDLNKEKATAGSIYAFYKMFTTNNVITGHNSRVSGTMFHQLHHIQEFNLGESKCAYKDCSADLTNANLPDFKTYKGRILTVNIHGVEAQWEIFSMYETPASSKYEQLEYNTWYHPSEHWLTETEDIQKWIDTQVENSQYDFSVAPAPTDTFLTISTCGNEHKDSSGGNYARLYFFLRRVS